MTDAHVLVVDDDELHRELVADYLTLGGFAVRQARDGREALALMGQEVPALVMLDVQMPELDGVAVVAAMRRDAALAEVPVLFLSGVAAPHLRIRALELGADDFISKQCPPAEILARVRATLRRRPVARGAALSGTLGPAGVALDDVIQTLLIARHSGRIALPELPAELVCVGGQIIDARFREHRGATALERIVLAARGRFAVELGPAAPAVGGALSLMAAMVAVDEARASLGARTTTQVALGPDPLPEPLARRRALFPLSVGELVLALDGDLGATTATVIAALAAGHLVPVAQRPEDT